MKRLAPAALCGIFICSVFCAFAGAANEKTDPAPPNIVVLLADDLGWGDVGYNGGVAKTPNIDKLAKEGVVLTNFHVCPLCSPTRAGLLTGRWPIRFGMGESVITPWRQWGMATSEETIADMLAKGDYQRRGAVGKWHLGHYRREYLPTNRGFTDFYGHYNGAINYFTLERENQRDWHRNEQTCKDQGYATYLIGREAARFIKESPKDKPFFLYVPFNAPHTPFHAKESDITKYPEEKDNRARIYKAMIDSMDQAIGKILDAIDDKGIADNTLVLFFSDNGGISICGDNGDWRGTKGAVYEGGIRVPAVIRWPAGIKGGRTVDDMMGMVDVYPTLKRVARITAADKNKIDGIDVLDIIRGDKKAPKRDWFSYIAQGSPDKLAVCDDHWKLVSHGANLLDVTIDESGKRTDEYSETRVELFNMKKDPGERTDVLADNAAVAADMLERLKAFRRLKTKGIPHFREGAKEFVAPKEWVITK